ncbi:uncharacterized protein LOC120277026 isoform X1 [Dioscorea cayenensis subsp. rotundata]|uniref:Uncharacterized protein LOC120277026 isoform X1 n=1 Tax=Dioscorea cayennensis subsp. rotundata TaxID=55577 RepID=A0AB40CJZ0_DIOCR|nr:uncharacterized protein LOC120277026 isoform X1 [Dioscorea cayenensis subsp. rotundata]
MGACSPSPSPLSARSPKWQIRANPCSSEFPDCYRRGWRGSRLSDGCARVRPTTRIRVVDGGADLVAPPEITWQIAIGSLGTPLLSLPFQLSFGCSSFLTPQFSNSSAGVMPFVVAAIEFSKRIVAQRKCGLCGGSGLVQRENYYVKCPGCGGFLPWQSWKRFFTG